MYNKIHNLHLTVQLLDASNNKLSNLTLLLIQLFKILPISNKLSYG